MRAALALLTLLAAPAAAQGIDSLYCHDSQALAVKGKVGGPLHFDLSIFWPNQQYFGIRGDAAPQGGGWVYSEGMSSSDPADHCAVRLTPVSGGIRFETASNARCESMGGYGAAPQKPLDFPASIRVGRFAPVGMEDPVPKGC